MLGIVEEIVVPPEPASARLARQFVTASLASCADDLVDTAQLLVSELVTNALLRARTQIRVGVECTADRVRVEVGDASTARVTQRQHSAEATTGRGLDLVEAIAGDWGVATADKGKTVWFELGVM